MHESTGLIEVFFLNKPMCPSWPSGAGAGLKILEFRILQEQKQLLRL